VHTVVFPPIWTSSPTLHSVLPAQQLPVTCPVLLIDSLFLCAWFVLFSGLTAVLEVIMSVVEEQC